jgi:predicted Zn-dependent protease
MDRDICNPIITYVFGEAYMGGRAWMSARLSATPLANRFQNASGQGRKGSLHEIGHTLIFSLPHGPMRHAASNNLAELDDKLNYLCDYCEIFLLGALRRDAG